MSRVLEGDPGLTILRLWVGVDPSVKGTSRSRNESHQVVFWQVQLPGTPADPPASIRPEQLGLPRTFEDAGRFRYREPDFRLPGELATQLNEKLEQRDAPAAPLWLELAQPTGTLSFVPWERLLQPRLNVPVIRLPFFGIPAVANPGSLDVVFCASSPVAKQPIHIEELLGRIIEHAIQTLPDDSNLHVFTDVRSFPEMADRLRSRAVRQSSHRIFLYDPRQSTSLFWRHRGIEEDPEEQPPDRSGAIHNPWLQWIQHSLGQRGIDAVHFLAHGYLAAEQGALALAESPMENRDETWARFIGSSELSAFLTRIGAWSVSFSVAPMNFSVLGLRLLTDQLARQRVGPVMLHDMTEGDAETLGRALRFIVGAGTPDDLRPTSMDQLPVALYCHPSLAGTVDSMEEANEFLMRHTLAGGRTGDFIRQSAPLPSWLLAAQRTLERSSAELMESRQSQPADPERIGIERALSFLSSIVDKHPSSVAMTGTASDAPDAAREVL